MYNFTSLNLNLKFEYFDIWYCVSGHIDIEMSNVFIDTHRKYNSYKESDNLES